MVARMANFGIGRLLPDGPKRSILDLKKRAKDFGVDLADVDILLRICEARRVRR
jgi:hypothetical protein